MLVNQRISSYASLMNTFMTPLGAAEQYRFETIVAPNLKHADVRIYDAFCSERDMRAVENGSVVYPDQIKLDWTPIVVSTGNIALNLGPDHVVLSVDIP